MGQVRQRHIKNLHIHTMFYEIPCVRNQVAFRHMTYIGKYCAARSLTYQQDTSLPGAITQGNREANFWQKETTWFGTFDSLSLGSTAPAQCHCGTFILSIQPTCSCCWTL